MAARVVAAAGHDRCIVSIKPENVDRWLQAQGNQAELLAILDDPAPDFYEQGVRVLITLTSK